MHSLFIILMAGNVGYFTNYLAIRMLFQPKQGKVLGWEGLVPKNKAHIADSLANSVQTRLLSPDIILEYVHENGLIEKAAQNLTRWVDEKLDQPEVRQRITEYLVKLLQDHGEEMLDLVFNQAERLAKDLASDPEQVKTYWAILRDKITEYLSKKENRAQLAATAKKFFEQEIPRLAELIDQALVGYLRDRETVGAIGIGLKRAFSIDQDAIQAALERFVTDAESSELFARAMDPVAEDLINRLAAEGMQERVVDRVGDWLSWVTDFARQDILPVTAERLKDYFQTDTAWQQVDDLVQRAIASGKDSAYELLASSSNTEFVKQQIAQVVQRLNVTSIVREQIMKLDTDELEALVLDNTGGNLVMIQILGGVLGIIVGSVQVDIRFSLPLGALLLVVYLAFSLNRRQYRSP